MMTTYYGVFVKGKPAETRKTGESLFDPRPVLIARYVELARGFAQGAYDQVGVAYEVRPIDLDDAYVFRNTAV